MLTYKQVATDLELNQILHLQQLNLPENLSKEEKANQGFVTVEHSFELLKEMNVICQHTIAVTKGKVVGYALSMHPDFGDKIPVLKPMVAQIHKVTSDPKYIIMGQVCIAKEHRGKGLFRGLYSAMKEFLPHNFDKIITQIAAENTRSINAHQAIGFKELTRYWADDKEWSLVVL